MLHVIFQMHCKHVQQVETSDIIGIQSYRKVCKLRVRRSRQLSSVYNRKVCCTTFDASHSRPSTMAYLILYTIDQCVHFLSRTQLTCAVLTVPAPHPIPLHLPFPPLPNQCLCTWTSLSIIKFKRAIFFVNNTCAAKTLC